MAIVRIEFEKDPDETIEQAVEKLNGHHGLRVVSVKLGEQEHFTARIEFPSVYEMKLTIAELFGLLKVGETDKNVVAAAINMAPEYYIEEEDHDDPKAQ